MSLQIQWCWVLKADRFTKQKRKGRALQVWGEKAWRWEVE